MSLINNIKLKIGNYFCREIALNSKIKRKSVNYEQAKKIGILYTATNQENFEVVKNYTRKIRESKKTVRALGFVNHKELHRDQSPTVDLDFFTLKDVNWYYKPGGHIVENFTNENYDILICLDTESSLSVQYILANSKANFRVGKYEERNKIFFDFMIDLQNKNNLSYFIEQVNHYINLINN